MANAKNLLAETGMSMQAITDASANDWPRCLSLSFMPTLATGYRDMSQRRA
jgi:hypothetical protein